MYSRQHEFEADEYASKHAASKNLVSALVKLYKDNASRVKNRTLLDEEINKVFVELSAKTLKKLLKKSGIAFGQINTVKELSTHLALKKQVIEINKKKITIPASPLVKENGGVKRIPKIGEHNSKINEEFGRENPSG